LISIQGNFRVLHQDRTDRGFDQHCATHVANQACDVGQPGDGIDPYKWIAVAVDDQAWVNGVPIPRQQGMHRLQGGRKSCQPVIVGAGSCEQNADANVLRTAQERLGGAHLSRASPALRRE